MLCLG
jgi:hypothetical protein